MVQTELPKWLKQRYEVLWGKFKETPFNAETIEELFKEQAKGMTGINVLLSELRKAGWLTVEKDPEDKRVKIYRLKREADIEREALTPISLSRSEIERILKKAADLIRTRVDYKFILILLFYKRISDKWEVEYEQAYKEALSDGLSEKQAKEEARSSMYHDFVIPEEYLWENLRNDVSKLPEKFSQGLKVLAEKNKDLKDIMDNADFIQFARSRENSEILRQLVELFSERRLHHISTDILGDAYEWVLRYFAPTKAKEGEVYTPREVIQLLVEILNPQPGESVYDPACGSSGMLIVAYKHVEDSQGKEAADRLFLYGQEANPKSLTFGRMNMYIHDIRNGHLAVGDTLLYPKFKGKKGVKKFDHVVANPPWNQKGYDEEIIKKADHWQDRFPFGFVTSSYGDWAWIQHMLSSAKNDGKIAVVLDDGSLYRGGKEQVIRKQILLKQYVECVISLPGKLFYNTGDPGTIWIFNKNLPPEQQGKVFFINAAKEYSQHPDVRKLNLLSAENISHIVEVFRKKEEVAHFSKYVSHEEIAEYDFNMTTSLFVHPGKRSKKISLEKKSESLKLIQQKNNSAKNDVAKLLKEINQLQSQATESETLKIEQFCTLDTGATPSTKNKSYWGGSIPWLSSAEIHQKFITKAEKHITEAGMKNSNAKLLPKDSVLIALNGQGRTKGAAAYLAVEASCSQSLVCLIPDKNVIDPLFLYYYLNHKYYDIRRMSGTDSRAGLNMGLIGMFKVDVPKDLSLQREFAKKLREVDKLLANMQSELAIYADIQEEIAKQLLSPKSQGVDDNGKA